EAEYGWLVGGPVAFVASTLAGCWAGGEGPVMAVATVDDVQERVDRPLSEDERRLAEVLLGDVEAMIRARIRDLDARVAADSNYRALVVKIEAAAVLRVLRNPEGYRQETEGNYGYSLSAAVASGHLFVMDSEWAELGARGGAF